MEVLNEFVTDMNETVIENEAKDVDGCEAISFKTKQSSVAVTSIVT